jgi:hypothetical protein
MTQPSRLTLGLLLAGMLVLQTGSVFAGHVHHVTISPVDFEESAGRVVLTVTTWCTNEITVRYETRDETATGGRDYSPAQGSMRISGASSHSFEIEVLQDEVLEGHEWLSLVLRGLPNGSAGGGGGPGQGDHICIGGGPDSPPEAVKLRIIDDDVGSGSANDSERAVAGSGSQPSAAVSRSIRSSTYPVRTEKASPDSGLCPGCGESHGAIRAGTQVEEEWNKDPGPNTILYSVDDAARMGLIVGSLMFAAGLIRFARSKRR